jgi:hypothetical protein
MRIGKVRVLIHVDDVAQRHQAAAEANGWIIQPDAPIEVPVLVLALVAVVLGLRAMILVSSSISDPVHDVIDAMTEVERGRLGT